MTLHTPDQAAFKRAAKALSGLPGAGALSACQTFLAQSIGFRDFHHYQATSFAKNMAAPPSVQLGVIQRLHAATGWPQGDILNAFVQTRFFEPKPDIATTLRLREDLFAEQYTVVGRSSLGAPCRLSADGGPRQRALLVERGKGRDGLTRAMTDHAIRTCVSYELPAHRAGRFFIPLRFWMPYGIWTEEDGSQVIFSRDYCPLWKITEGRAAQRDDPDRHCLFKDQKWFFDEGSFRGPVEKVAEQGLDILRNHGVVSMPHLVEWLPECLERNLWISELKRWPWDKTSPRKLIA